ncbi:MAG: LD-carboxypeptidase [Candidatus Pacearchaeota archaeon]|nr:LD-carboxypeptidase [Candidatus Pacearchaeota archaeon]MCX6750332.1 LD-carboxypeptidase [Candidatus Pacearchaeota archaeon]
MGIIMPQKLKKGSIIAIISPSSGLAAIFPHRLDNAIKFLKSEGYKIKEFPCTRKINGWESAPAKERARDIMDAFLNKEVKAIICSIGGNTINKTIRYLDFEKIKENPKIFIGYSDISVLHYALNKKCGFSTFYGPCAMTQFGEYPEPLGYTLKHFRKAVVEGQIGIIKASEKWTDEILDWSQKQDLKRARKLKENKGFEWLKEGKSEGEIIGGCLPSICNLIGTEYWPDHNNKILFIEIPEAQQLDKGEPLAEVDALLCNLEIAGIFKQIKGLIVGRPFRYDNAENEKFKEIILDNTKEYNFPILYGVDIGHTDPQITIPLGAKVKLDSNENRLEILGKY